MADAAVSNTAMGNHVWVRLPLSAPTDFGPRAASEYRALNPHGLLRYSGCAVLTYEASRSALSQSRHATYTAK